MRIVSTILIAAATLLASGCISTSDFEAAQRQIAELQEELASIKRTASSKEEVQNVNVRIAEQTEQLLRSNAQLVARVGAIESEIQQTQGGIEQSSHRVDQLTQQLAKAQRDVDDIKTLITTLQQTASPVTDPAAPNQAAPAPSSGEMNVPARQPASSADPMETYQAAYRDYQRGNFDLAIDGFRDFLAVNKVADLADNAEYWIAESLFSQKKYREAIAQFEVVVSKYPRSDKVPGALLKKGFSYINLGERAQGIVQLQYVVHEHPRSQEAGLARDRLRQLGVETR